MNPELPAPSAAPERQPQKQLDAEHVQGVEIAGERSHEQEQNIQPGDRQSAPPPVAVPLPPSPVALPAVPTPTSRDDTAGPTIANDDDLIEKEWVDKAKKIISETQDNPYLREKQVNQLQSDYLRKRYGKELGTSN